MELRWTIGCRSRKLCRGNVCLCDWTVPWVYVNWAHCNHTQAHMISVCSPGKGGWDYPPAWMFHFEAVIEMDFCRLLSHSDGLLKVSDSPSSSQTCTLRWIPESFWYIFSRRVSVAFMHPGSMAPGMATWVARSTTLVLIVISPLMYCGTFCTDIHVSRLCVLDFGDAVTFNLAPQWCWPFCVVVWIAHKKNFYVPRKMNFYRFDYPRSRQTFNLFSTLVCGQNILISLNYTLGLISKCWHANTLS